MLDVLFGEVDVGVDAGEDLGELFLHAAHGAGQLFGIKGKTRAHLGFAFAVDHVDKPFRRGEGELAVEEGALGEFAPLRQTAAER